MSAPTELRCYGSRPTSDCDETLASKLRASLRLVRKPAIRIQQQTSSSCAKGKARR